MLTHEQIKSIIERDLPRQRAVRDAWRRYESEWDDTLAPTVFDPRGRDNTPYNLSKQAINIVASTLMGQGVDFTVNSQDGSGEDVWLDEFWEENRKAILLNDVALSGGVAGDVYLWLEAPALGDDYPTLHNLDAQNVSVLLNQFDHNQADAYIISEVHQSSTSFMGGDGQVRTVRVVQRDEQGTWTISQTVLDAARGTTFAQAEPVLWPFPWAPIFHAKNLPNPHCFWGAADLDTDMQRANQNVNRAIATTNRIQRLYGNPHLIAKGMKPGSKIDISPGAVTMLESKDASLEKMEASSLSDQSDIVRLMRELFYSSTDIPEIAMGKLDSIGQLSGLALKILYGPLLRKVSMKQTLYGELLRDVSRRALELAGYARAKVTINWPDPLPSDASTELDDAAKKIALGVSAATVLGELGYKVEEEQKKQSPAPSPTPDTGSGNV